MKIRAEVRGDAAAIRNVVEDAFGRHEEAELVDNLRQSGDLALSLVALKPGRLCGHVALSRMTSPERAFALGPVSVSRAEQNAGIGSALIREAMKRARKRQAAIVFVLGDPRFYGRFSFSAEPAKAFPSPYAGAYFMARVLDPAKIKAGSADYPASFNGLE